MAPDTVRTLEKDSVKVSSVHGMAAECLKMEWNMEINTFSDTREWQSCVATLILSRKTEASSYKQLLTFELLLAWMDSSLGAILCRCLSNEAF